MAKNKKGGKNKKNAGEIKDQKPQGVNKDNQEEERVPVKEMAAVKAEEPKAPERPGNSPADLEQQEGAFAVDLRVSIQGRWPGFRTYT